MSETQRQKLHLARALLKRPDILIVNQALNSLGSREQGEMIDMVLAQSNSAEGDEKLGVIWSPMQIGFSEKFDRILIFEDGNLVEDNTAASITADSKRYQELVG